jgi:hypothetical protein
LGFGDSSFVHVSNTSRNGLVVPEAGPNRGGVGAGSDWHGVRSRNDKERFAAIIERHGLSSRCLNGSKNSNEDSGHESISRRSAKPQRANKAPFKATLLLRPSRGKFEEMGKGKSWKPASSAVAINEEQAAAVEHILRARDLVTAVRGVAGSGKTTMLDQTVRRIGS